MFATLYEEACNQVESVMVNIGLNLPFSSYQFLYPPKSDKFNPDNIAQMISEEKFPTFKSLAPVIVWCALFSIVRFVFQGTIGENLTYAAMSINKDELRDFVHRPDVDKALPSKKKKPPAIEDVDKYWRVKSLNEDELKTYLTKRYRKECNERKVSKFIEAFWRCIFYTVFVGFAYLAMFHPEPIPWVKDMEGCWKSWPEHVVIPALQTYHYVQLGCYLHQLLWTEVTRSDAFEMMVHHIVTITLITISYLINLQRIGSIIMLVHDLADIFLESAKLCNYVSKAKHKFTGIAKTLSDVLFAIFAVVFFVTRLIIFPFWVLHSVYVHGGQHAFNWLDPTYLGGKVVTFSLSTLQILHVFWFYTICKMIYKLLTTGIEGDERSDDDEGNPISSKISVNSDGVQSTKTGVMDAHSLPGGKKKRN